MHTTRVVAVIIAGGLSLAACGSSSGSGSATSGPIKIGMVAPLTGPYAALGSGDKAAAEQEVKKINAAGGVMGRKLQLSASDDKGDQTQSVTEFSRFATDKGVSAILSSAVVTASTAVGPSAISNKVPTLALGPVAAFADGSNPYAFTVTSPNSAYAAKLVEYFASTGVKTLSIGYNGKDVYGSTGNAATKDAAKAAGIKVVMDEPFDPGATDFTALITKAKKAKADAFVVWAAGPAPVIIAKQLQGTGISMVGTGANASNLFTEPAGKAAEGMVMGSSIALVGDDLPSGVYKDLVTGFSTTWKSTHKDVAPPQFAFDGAAGIELVAAAIKKAGSSDREAIRKALETLDVLTVTGHYTMSKTNHAGLDKTAVAVVQVKNGAFTVTDFSRKLLVSELPK